MEHTSLEKQLPIEIVDMILDMLPLPDIIRFSMICKAYFVYITHSYHDYWKSLYLKKWKVCRFCVKCVSIRCDCSCWNTKRDWKSQYLERREVEDAFNSGGFTLIYQKNDVSSKNIKTVDSIVSCNGPILSVSEYGANRSIRIMGESVCITSLALVFPETIAISVNGKGIILYDYLTLSEKTSINVHSVSRILVNSTRLACIDSKTMIKVWKLYDHGTKSQFHGLFWEHSHPIKDIQFYKDTIVSFDEYQCYVWDLNTKNCIKIINCEIHKAVVYKNIIGLFSFGHLQIFRQSKEYISKVDHIPLSFIIKDDDQFTINSDKIMIKTRLTEHEYNIQKLL